MAKLVDYCWPGCNPEVRLRFWAALREHTPEVLEPLIEQLADLKRGGPLTEESVLAPFRDWQTQWAAPEWLLRLVAEWIMRLHGRALLPDEMVRLPEPEEWGQTAWGPYLAGRQRLDVEGLRFSAAAAGYDPLEMAADDFRAYMTQMVEAHIQRQHEIARQFGFVAAAEARLTDTHCRWAVLRRFRGMTNEAIAGMENPGEDGYEPHSIGKSIQEVERAVGGFEPRRRGRPNRSNFPKNGFVEPTKNGP